MSETLALQGASPFLTSKCSHSTKKVWRSVSVRHRDAKNLMTFLRRDDGAQGKRHEAKRMWRDVHQFAAATSSRAVYACRLKTLQPCWSDKSWAMSRSSSRHSVSDRMARSPRSPSPLPAVAMYSTPPPPPRQYATAVALSPAENQRKYGEQPVLTICPICGHQVVTELHYQGGFFSSLLCMLLCCCGCFLGCCMFPFCCVCCQDVIHICPRCGAVIYRYNRL